MAMTTSVPRSLEERRTEEDEDGNDHICPREDRRAEDRR